MSALRRAALALAVLAGAAGCGGPQLNDVNGRLSLDQEALDFGERPVLDDLTLKLHATNLGRAPLVFVSVSIEGDPAFTVTGGESRLEGGAETDFLVTFKALVKQPYAAKLVLVTDETEPRHEVPLTGIGATAASATIDPPCLDFGRVGEGRTVVKRVRITSTGSADLKVKTIELKPGSSAAYGFVGSTRTPQTLKAHVEGVDDAFAEVTVKFSPTAIALETEGTVVLETTDPDHAMVEICLKATINRQPVAEAGSDRMVAPGSAIALDGSASTDPDGDLPLTYKWTLAQKPQGSNAALAGDTAAQPTFTTDQPGLYAVDLVVTDAAGLASKPKRVAITAVTADKLVIELIWDHPTADLDLHVLRPGDSMDGIFDCSWAHPHPDWGVAGNTDDDPAHLGDRLSGFGPEYVVYEAPVDGNYDLAVKYVSPQGSAQLQVKATVRVYLFGVVVRELTKTLTAPGELWRAAEVTWPSGAVSDAPQGTP
jgi:hypothetical protein